MGQPEVGPAGGPRQGRDYFTPISFMWPVGLLLPFFLYSVRVTGGDALFIYLFRVVFFAWLPFYLLYLVAYASLTLARLDTLRTLFYSIVIAWSSMVLFMRLMVR